MRQEVYGREVIDRLTHLVGSVADHSGCSTRPFSDFQNSVRMVSAGLSHSSRPITSDVPVGRSSRSPAGATIAGPCDDRSGQQRGNGGDVWARRGIGKWAMG